MQTMKSIVGGIGCYFLWWFLFSVFAVPLVALAGVLISGVSHGELVLIVIVTGFIASYLSALLFAWVLKKIRPEYSRKMFAVTLLLMVLTLILGVVSLKGSLPMMDLLVNVFVFAIQIGMIVFVAMPKLVKPIPIKFDKPIFEKGEL